MDNKKKGNSRSSSNTSRGKAGSGKSKPAFAFDKSSDKGRGAGRSAGSREDRPSGGSRGASKSSGRSSRPASGELSRDEKKSISDANFKKRSSGGFGDKKRNSSTAGFSKSDKPSSGPRTKNRSEEPSTFRKKSEGGSGERNRTSSSGRSERPSTGPRGAGSRTGGFKKEGGSSERSERTSSGPRGGAGSRTGGFKKEGGSSERSERTSSGPRGGAGSRTGGFKKEGDSSERSERTSSGPRGGAGKAGGFKKEGTGSFDKKRTSSFGNKPERLPKSFGRGSKKEESNEESGFNEDEFFGRTRSRSVEDELNARKRGPKKVAVKKTADAGLTKRAEKALVRRKVDKDFIDIKFNKEKEMTDSLHRELNVKKARSKETPVEEGIRLNRYLSNAGIASRREADQFIQEGLVKVNGKVVTELGTKVMPGDSVKYGSKIISPEKPVYVLLNKPKDFITTTDDPQERRTVMALVANACKERIVPVGRLDRNTTGLLLFTNDGDLAQKLTHPSSKIKKIYLIELNKPIAEKDFETIKSGKLRLFDGPVKVDDLAVTDQTRKILGIEIHEGRNRIVRRIFEELGYEVEKLDRVAYAGLTKKDLSRGKWRFLSAQEINRLKYLE
ncbi:MAG: rluB [Chitinophagaceae bacterium]|nr:rluB [Chitinophagaceae bacterium]